MQDYVSMFYLSPRTSKQESFDAVSKITCRNTFKLQDSIIQFTVKTHQGKVRFSFKLLDMYVLTAYVSLGTDRVCNFLIGKPNDVCLRSKI